MNLSCMLNGLDKEGYRALSAKLASTFVMPFVDKTDEGDVYFLRTFYKDACGSIGGFKDTELDGVTSYTPTGEIQPSGGTGGGLTGPFIETEDAGLYSQEEE